METAGNCKKKLVRKIFITGKKTVRNEQEMKDKYLLRKPWALII